jgi:hypothetical protein
MSDPRELYIMLKRDNFSPLRIRMSSGDEFIIRRPQDAFIMDMNLYVGLDMDETGFPRRGAFLAVEQITSVEPMSKNLTVPQEPGSDQPTDGSE